MSSILSRNAALRGLLDQHLAALSQEEGLAPETITSAIEAGSMVLLGNPAHAGLAPIVVGQPSRIKVNANIGTSPLCNCLHTEKRKLAVALEAGADTVMDLSIAGDLDAIRTGMLAACPRPLGTVPMYSVGQQILDNDRDIASMQPDDLFAEIEKQARQGVDFMTVHCGLTKRGAEMAVKQDRVMGVVSRGGSMLARWMLELGVDHIIGSHPHVVQPVEIVDTLPDKRPHVVAYSLGNFISNMSLIHTDGGLAVKLLLRKSNGITRLADCGYSFVWTSRPALSGKRNYAVYPSNVNSDKLNAAEKNRMEMFLSNARRLFRQHAIGIKFGIKEYFFEKKTSEKFAGSK